MGRPSRTYGLRARWCNWPPLRLARMRCERESVGVVVSTALLVVDVEQEVPGGQVDRVGRASRLLPGRDR